MVRPAGIGFSIASCTAYMTMNGVLNASVSAGSSQRAARVTWSAQRISPDGGLAVCALMDVGSTAMAAQSATAKRMKTEGRERARSTVVGMAFTLAQCDDRVDRASPRG